MSIRGVLTWAPSPVTLIEVIAIENETTVRGLTRSSVELCGLEDISEYLDNAYGARLRLRFGLAQTVAPRLIHHRIDAGAFVIDDIDLPGDVEASPDPLEKVLVVWTNRGRVVGHCDGIDGRAAAGDITLLTQPDLPHVASSHGAQMTSVLLAPSLVLSVAGLAASQAPIIRFTSFTPVDATAAKLWKDTVTYVKDLLTADERLITPLMLENAGQLLASVAMAAFPSAIVSGSVAPDRVDHQPALLRRAIEYIEANVMEDISLSDIADAIHVTPRAVQYMFRRHLGTTPLQYLRHVRLNYAHMDLLASDRWHDTVTSISARWGFAHTGRFAVQYREIFGQSPHTTLRS